MSVSFQLQKNNKIIHPLRITSPLFVIHCVGVFRNTFARSYNSGFAFDQMFFFCIEIRIEILDWFLRLSASTEPPCVHIKHKQMWGLCWSDESVPLVILKWLIHWPINKLTAPSPASIWHLLYILFRKTHALFLGGGGVDAACLAWDAYPRHRTEHN